MTQNIQIMTDPENFNNIKEASSAQVLVVTGDLYHMKNKNDFLDWASNKFRHTYIVMGNEDYYSDIDVAETMLEYQNSVLPNVTYVNNLSVMLNGQELFMTTLWYPVDENHVLEALHNCDDFDRIHCNGKRLTNETINQLHEICTQWLVSVILKSNARIKTVVCHYRPSEDSVLFHILETIGVNDILSHHLSI